jgi:hypothetical protein
VRPRQEVLHVQVCRQPSQPRIEEHGREL